MMIQEKGRGLKALRLIKMQLGEPDSSGRRRPVPLEGSDFEVEADTVISAIGQYADTSALAQTAGLLDERGFLKCDEETGRTGVPGVFAAGDLATGADIAIRAIAGGKHSARAILAWLAGGEYRRPVEFLSKKDDFGKPTEAEFKQEPRVARQAMPMTEASARVKSFEEIEQGFSAEQARAEARRCLECGCQDVHECRLKEYAQEYGASPLTLRRGNPEAPHRREPPLHPARPGQVRALRALHPHLPGGAGSGRAGLCAPRLPVPGRAYLRGELRRGPAVHQLRAVRLRLPGGGAHGEDPRRQDRAFDRSDPGGLLLPVLGGLPRGAALPRRPAGAREGAHPGGGGAGRRRRGVRARSRRPAVREGPLRAWSSCCRPRAGPVGRRRAPAASRCRPPRRGRAWRRCWARPASPSCACPPCWPPRSWTASWPSPPRATSRCRPKAWPAWSRAGWSLLRQAGSGCRRRTRGRRRASHPDRRRPGPGQQRGLHRLPGSAAARAGPAVVLRGDGSGLRALLRAHPAGSGLAGRGAERRRRPRDGAGESRAAAGGGGQGRRAEGAGGPAGGRPRGAHHPLLELPQRGAPAGGAGPQGRGPGGAARPAVGRRPVRRQQGGRALGSGCRAAAGQAELFIPLPRAAFLSGLGKPSGREPLQAGELDKALLQNLLVG